jgi:hypothetical protein
MAFANKAPSNGGRGGYRGIIEREDDELRRAGIYPGHPSLTVSPMKDGSTAAPAVESTGEREP